jgi:predicted phosphodiesterase
LFLSDETPILINLPRNLEYADIYFIHDLHYKSELFDERKWKALKEKIMVDDNAYVIWIGDLMENAIPNSKSDMFTQQCPPFAQKEWVASQMFDMRKKTLAVVSGNHESNRTTKVSGLYPIYDICMYAGVDDKYRDTIAYIDIGIGTRKDSKNKQVHYFGQVQHKAKDLQSYGTSDYTDGIDFFAFGHDHSPKDRPRAKMVFDHHNKMIYKRNIENINSGSFCKFGGYGSKNAYRPQSDKMYKLRIFGGEKKMETTGFYV